MKKIKYIIFALFLSVILIPNVSAKGVEIKSITLDTKSNNTEEKSNPTHSGLTMNFSIGFKEKDDFIKYKVVVKNDTDIDYKISTDTSFHKSEYITYKYETTGDLKANSELTVFVTLTYSNEIDPSLLVDDKYTETNKAVLKLLDKNGNPANPNTGVNTYLVITLLLLSILIVTLLITKKHNKIKGLSLLVIGLFLIPTLVYAVETLKLTINVNAEILREYKVAYITNQSVFYTDSELEQLSEEEKMQCERIYYIGEMTEENKYNLCHIKYIEDEQTYSPGEKVELKEIPLRKLKTKEYSVEDPGFYCVKQTTNTYLCDGEHVETTTYMKKDWDYEEINTGFGTINSEFKLFDNDKDIMKFSNIIMDEWDNNKRLQLEAPQTFTMPRHNVLFQQFNFI